VLKNRAEIAADFSRKMQFSMNSEERKEYQAREGEGFGKGLLEKGILG
jgi:hypothetical protein